MIGTLTNLFCAYENSSLSNAVSMLPNLSLSQDTPRRAAFVTPKSSNQLKPSTMSMHKRSQEPGVANNETGTPFVKVIHYDIGRFSSNSFLSWPNLTGFGKYMSTPFDLASC